ncbi:MAG: glutamine--fructose-6-phosphate transaminase (isomerizing) [Ruminococcaceae bacterium]|nr:glutamine--fructose-6-phosphate transaminase (isomerizing) [Oscillospiraceae bacterium]
MCGIVGFVGNKKAAPVLLGGLERLEYRGYDSAGITVINNNKFETNKTVKRISALKEATENGEAICGKIGIGHTRWATHGAPCEKNAHPHLGFKGRFMVVHNGIIENYLELKNELEAEGVAFASDTDTEVIAHILEKHYTGDVFAAISKTVSRLEGSFALGILCVEQPEILYAVRNFSPLIIGLGEGENFIASDVTALVSHTKKVLYMEDKEIAVIKENSVDLFTASGIKIHRSPALVNWSVDAAEKGGYSHFMMKEIKEQPEVIAKTFEPRIKDDKVFFEGLKLTEEKLQSINRIIITACGSAYHTGVVAKYVFEELLRLPVEVDLASEFRYRNPIVDENTLVIIISQSGETADTLAALKEAKARGAHILSIVNVVGSSIAKASDDVIYTWAGPEIAVATTKAYSAQLIVLYLFGIYAAEKRSSADSKLLKTLLDEIRLLPQKISSVFEMEDTIKSLAENHYKMKNTFFIGRNIDYAAAMEGSLKLKEISYLNSEAYAAGELKHGTISLIEQGKIVIALSAYEGLQDKMMSNIKEVKARDAFVIATAIKGNTAIEKEADEVLYLPETHPLLLASVEVVPLQMFAYYVALFNGCDIDKPRNLAKSVTVE